MLNFRDYFCSELLGIFTALLPFCVEQSYDIGSTLYKRQINGCEINRKVQHALAVSLYLFCYISTFQHFHAQATSSHSSSGHLDIGMNTRSANSEEGRYYSQIKGLAIQQTASRLLENTFADSDVSV